MMEDRYTPDSSATATCPHCATRIPGAPNAADHVLLLATLVWRCPRCEQRWNEVRYDGEATRLWEPR